MVMKQERYSERKRLKKTLIAITFLRAFIFIIVLSFLIYVSFGV